MIVSFEGRECMRIIFESREIENVFIMYGTNTMSFHSVEQARAALTRSAAVAVASAAQHRAAVHQRLDWRAAAPVSPIALAPFKAVVILLAAPIAVSAVVAIARSTIVIVIPPSLAAVVIVIILSPTIAMSSIIVVIITAAEVATLVKLATGIVDGPHRPLYGRLSGPIASSPVLIVSRECFALAAMSGWQLVVAKASLVGTMI